MDQAERRKVREALLSNEELSRSLGLRNTPPAKINGSGFVFLMIQAGVSLWIISFCLFHKDGGPFAALVWICILWAFWGASYSTCVTLAHSSELFGASKGRVILTSEQIREQNRKQEAIDRILDSTTDPVDKMLSNLDDPAYVQQLVEAQKKFEKA